MRTIDAQMLAAFSEAAFPPYALDGRWSGLRRIAGHSGPRGGTTSLTLAFGEDVRDLTLPEIHVETRWRAFAGLADPVVAAKTDALLLARRQVEHLWRRTGVLRDDVRRTTFPRDGTQVDDPTSPWDRAPIAVDDDVVEFAVLSEGADWVAQAIVGEHVVGIEARHWRLDATGVVTETDFAPYVRGAREMRRRMTP